MSHLTTIETISKRDNILPFAHSYQRKHSDYSNYHNNLTIHDDKIYDDYDDAYEAINKLGTGSYSDHAVKFHETVESNPSKKLEKMISKYLELETKIKQFDDDTYVCNRKSTLIGCNNCGSKLSKEFLQKGISFARKNVCPVCRQDLRSKTILNRLNKYQSNLNKLNTEIQIQRKTESDKGPIKWLVKVEIHC